MVRQETGEFEYAEPSSDAGEFAGWDPYVIWLCNEYTAPLEDVAAEAQE